MTPYFLYALNPQAQFGRRWTKISKLVGSRTVFQVKSYARQYFKHKVTLSSSLHLSQLSQPNYI